MVEVARDQPDNKPHVSRADVFSISNLVGGGLPFVQQRLAALDHYRELTVPDRVAHLWRYSDPYSFLPDLTVVPIAVVRPAEETHLADGVDRVVLAPGRVPKIDVWENGQPGAIDVQPLSTSEEGLSYLGRAVSFDHGLLEALNAAVWSAGIMVRVPRGVTWERPLHIVHVASQKNASTRVVIVVEDGASVSVVERFTGGGRAHRPNVVSEQFVGSHGRCNHLFMQTLKEGTAAHLTSRAVVETGGVIHSGAISFGASRYKADMGLSLRGEGANARFSGIVLGHGRQRMDHHTSVIHEGSHTESNMAFRAAVAGRSAATYTGLIRIGENGQKSEASQECRNLLLSKRARAETIPELEILTNDVRCSHGATSSPIDPAHLFYLESRGIPRAKAVQMAVQGFLEETVSRFPSGLYPQLATFLEKHLAACHSEVDL